MKADRFCNFRAFQIKRTMSALANPTGQRFLRCQVPLLFCLLLLRVYECVAVAQRLFVPTPLLWEAAGLLYDLWLAAIFSALCFGPFWLLHRLSPKAAVGLQHLLNVLLLLSCIGLLLTFSERNTPFDHEFFTRKGADSWETVKQMTTAGLTVYIPVLVYLPLYLLLYFYGFRRRVFSRNILFTAAILATLCTGAIRWAQPAPEWFSEKSAFYLTTDKLSYWVADSYQYLSRQKKETLTDARLQAEISYYQRQQPFHFTDPAWPLLHRADEPDVLGSFFSLGTKPPNIVLLVVEGLSSDFSGRHAYAASFTPFLDSLSDQSLTWDNFLSTAPGTFAAQPALSGSVPFAEKGFAIQNVLPGHLSLTRLLRANGYHTRFFAGFDTDFDNMGGFIRTQGTDFMLNYFGPKYRKMGVGEEGWSMGYPDDALFARSFEVMDSMGNAPYFSIYHTGTTHMPYLFEQKASYDRKFDEKMHLLKVTPGIRRSLLQTKNVLATFLFSDDCLRAFFKSYARRPEWNNTIFLITGDHHIGSFPSTGAIDDYHVPLIVYSPMLKAPRRFASVNTHNELAPTLMQLLSHNYSLKATPADVPWIGSVLDTATAFRNIHNRAFMSWSREINDYIHGDWFLSGDELYRLTPTLLQEPVSNDSLRQLLTRMRDNFIRINQYVCANDRIFPQTDLLLPGKKKLLYEWQDSSEHHYNTRSADTSLAADFAVPKGYRYLFVEAEAEAWQPGSVANEHPTFRLALIDNKDGQRNYRYWSKRDIITLSKAPFVTQRWNTVTLNDLFTLQDHASVKELIFEWAVYTDEARMDLRLRGKKLRIWGIAD
jgi:hypothetical protein